MAQQLPIRFQEVANLVALGINQQYVTFNTLTMESDKYICVREEVNGQVQVVIIDLSNPQDIQRRPITADSAIMNPVSKVIALKAQNYLQIFNLEMKSKMKSVQMQEPVVFWKWVTPATVALVTGSAVYHWAMDGQSDPKKMFDRNPSLNDTQIINYKTSANEKWCVLIGIKSEPGTGRIVGAMQLFSVEKNVSQPIEGHAAAFAQFRTEGASTDSTLFTFASKGAAASKLHVTEVAPGQRPAGAPGFQKKAVDLVFPPEAANDFPVAMQVSAKHGVVYMVTKFGYCHVHDIETGSLIYSNRISGETIFVTTDHSATGGMLGVNRKGQVLSVALDENTVVPYIVNTHKNLQLALRLATRAGLPGAENLVSHQFEQFMAQGNYKEAAKIAANSPAGALRTQTTIQRFQQAPAVQGQPSPILTYFGCLLEKGKLNRLESVELAKPVLQQGKKEEDLLHKWLGEDKLDCSEELGDVVKPLDPNMALAIYLKANVPMKVIQCFMETGQFDKIPQYAAKVNFSADWGTVIENMVRVNPQGACELAQKLATNPNGPQVDFNQVTDIFMKYNCLQQATAFLLEALKGNKPEEGPLQTRLLEMNLMAGQPGVVGAIFDNDLFSHYDKARIAGLCEKAGLVQRALECYDEIADIKRCITRTDLLNPEWLVKYFGTLSVEHALECLHHLMRTNMRQNLQVIVQVAREYSEQLTNEKLIELFENYKSYEGLFYYLGAAAMKTEDPAVHFKYIEAATKVGNYQEVERVTRENTHYDPVQVKDFLKEARLPDQRPLINVCDRYDMVDELTQYLYANNMTKYIELYVTKVNPMKTPEVAGALLDADCGEDFVRTLILSVRGMCPAEALVEACEHRNRLKLLQPWLEARVNEGVQEPAVHNALMKIYVDMNNKPEEHLQTNMYYDSKVVGEYCEKRDPHLAFTVYKRGLCDQELIELTNKHGLFKQQARYLVERQDLELWETVLTNDNPHKRDLVDQVVQTALPETKSAEVVSITVKAFITADLPNELIELLDKIVLHGTTDEFRNNKNLQNLLLLTAIKADKGRVMDYINRLANYDAPDIANIAVGSELYEEALVIYKKHGYHREAAKVLIEYLSSSDRALEYADKVNEPEVWSMLAKSQLANGFVKESIASYIRADDGADYSAVIDATEPADAWKELCDYLQMCRKKTKESHIDSTLLYAYARCENYVAMEEFISSPNVAQIQGIGDRCYNEGIYEAAKVLFTSISNWSRLASSLIHLQEYQAAVDAARKANSAKTWKEVNAACVEAAEFRLAQICALHIIINPDELEGLIQTYEALGHFDEVISLMESGLNLERAHMGIFTELGILYAKYRPDKLMEHIKLFWSKLNIRKLLKSCEDNHHWPELVFLYTHYDEYDNACLTMIKHPADAWENTRFKETIAKVTNSEIFYKAIDFYLEFAPLQLVEVLTVVLANIDHVRVVHQLRKAGHLYLIKEYLLKVQGENIKEVNDALYELYVQDEDHEALAKSIDTFNQFDQIEMAKRCEAHELLQFRRIAAKLYMSNERYAQSIELSKGDQDWSTAIQTTADSGKTELAEQLLNFFVEQKNKACFAATLYTCYELLRPDVVMELAWRNGITDYAMPYMVQTMRHMSLKLEGLEKQGQKFEEKAKEEQNAAEQMATMGYADPGMGGYNGNALTVYGAMPGVGGGGMMGGPPQPPQYGGGMGYGGQGY
eukprot:CAMPEP_0206005570 /NCGR_PEP_ID=MMETSP1464-20131121/4652_1 /ASSEMBLY_ACC=CAM_ASM_001124 /TAXON_ID=119497 /ORGANISM="Exanthemachrysis gayraliae, Strain RCC1523" /LENGTH=1697 /DNA_ID=CAMNT_0053379013 /DNA_START=54 /DNA_END=5144 /DNA_ORIENTATION=+